MVEPEFQFVHFFHFGSFCVFGVLRNIWFVVNCITGGFGGDGLFSYRLGLVGRCRLGRNEGLLWLCRKMWLEMKLGKVKRSFAEIISRAV